MNVIFFPNRCGRRDALGVFGTAGPGALVAQLSDVRRRQPITDRPQSGQGHADAPTPHPPGPLRHLRKDAAPHQQRPQRYRILLGCTLFYLSGVCDIKAAYKISTVFS